MSAPVLGIDLGTTNSVVGVADDAGVRVLPTQDGESLIPSVVSFHPSGDILVGSVARERRLLDAKNTVYSVKRLIGRPFKSEEVRRTRERFAFDLQEGPTGGVLVAARGETYTLSEISAFVLRQVRTVAEQAIGQPCTKAVITVPANFNELQRSATKAAGRVAGLEVLRILNEPTAAALAYGYGRGSRERIAIFDLGGGTFDITILELAGEVFEVLATAGDTYLGGDDVDSLIAEQMADAFLEHHRYDPRQDRQAFERLRAAAEWAKCQLSLESEIQLRVEELAYGEGGVSLDLTFGMTREALEGLAQPLIARAFDVCEDAMRVAGISPTQLDNVVLVGGSTRMPLVRRMVSEYFGREAMADIDPDLVVAQGAAIQARALSTSRAKSAIGRVALKRMSQAELTAAQKKRAKGLSSSQASPQVGSIPPPPPVPATAARDFDPDATAAGPSAEQLEALILGTEDEEATAVHAHPSGPPPALPPAPAKMRSAPPPPPPPPPVARPAPAAPPVANDPVAIELPNEFDDSPFETNAVAPAAGAVVTAGAIAISGPGSAPPPMPAAPPRPAPPVGGQTLDGHPSLPSPEPMAPAPPMAPTPPMAPAQPAAPMAPPLLLDVTPLSLGVETVAGYCEHIIKRNSSIPAEQTRVFSTALDDQQEVVVQICQGESRRLEENNPLGAVQLTGLPAGPRGSVKIGVTFFIDANGTLAVTAQDMATGREQRVRINLIGGASDDDIAAMQARQEKLSVGDGR